jgi:hypothetical protein
MADAIEREIAELGTSTASTSSERMSFPLNAVATISARVTPRLRVPTGELTVENVKAFLKVKKARIRDLAYHFSAPEEAVGEIVDNPFNGIVIGDRGWLRCDEQEPLSFSQQEKEGGKLEEKEPGG